LVHEVKRGLLWQHSDFLQRSPSAYQKHNRNLYRRMKFDIIEPDYIAVKKVIDYMRAHLGLNNLHFSSRQNSKRRRIIYYMIIFAVRTCILHDMRMNKTHTPSRFGNAHKNMVVLPDETHSLQKCGKAHREYKKNTYTRLRATHT
jgi:hypothetical protein